MRTRTRAHARTLLTSYPPELLGFRKRVAQLRPGSMQPRLDGRNRKVEGLRHLLERQVGVVVEEYGQPVRGVEQRQRLDQGRVVPRKRGRVVGELLAGFG